MEGKDPGIARFPKKTADKIRAAFNQGLSSKELAFSISLAVVLGVFPFFYVPTLLVAFTAFRFRLNLAIMMAVNYLVYPLQIVLFVPLFHLGEWMLDIQARDIGILALLSHFSSDFFAAFKESLSIFYISIVAWAFVSIPSFIILQQWVLLLLRLRKKKQTYL